MANPTETVVDLEHDGVRTPGTVVDAGGGPRPAVLLLHGTASSRDEVGGLFARLAAALAERGVSSLRIDFAGCGDSDRPQPDLTIGSELADARAALDRLAADPAVDAARIGVLGFSQGGTVAALLAGEDPRVAALATWSSGVIPADRLDAAFAAAFAGGGDPVDVDLGFRTFTFSRAWWTGFRGADVRRAVAGFSGPVLAVAGTEDRDVPPSASVAMLEAAASTDTTLVEVAGADHVLGALDPAEPFSEGVVRVTADWLDARLG